MLFNMNGISVAINQNTPQQQFLLITITKLKWTKHFWCLTHWTHPDYCVHFGSRDRFLWAARARHCDALCTAVCRIECLSPLAVAQSEPVAPAFATPFVPPYSRATLPAHLSPGLQVQAAVWTLHPEERGSSNLWDFAHSGCGCCNRPVDPLSDGSARLEWVEQKLPDCSQWFFGSVGVLGGSRLVQGSALRCQARKKWEMEELRPDPPLHQEVHTCL